MTKSKRFLSALLALVMLMALCTTAAAADETYTVTINNDKTGHTYEAYQIFTGDLAGQKLANIAWGSGITSAGQTALQTAYNASDADGVAKAVTEAGDAAAFAKKAAAYLTGGTASTQGSGSYTIAGLAPGYYLIKDRDDSLSGYDAYTAFIVEIVGNSTLSPKSTLPTVTKKVRDINDSVRGAVPTGWQDSADYDVGDAVPFRLEATLGSAHMDKYGTYALIFRDELAAGLTSQNDYAVTVDGVPVAAEAFSVSGLPAGNGFSLIIPDVKALGAGNGSVVAVEYTALLTGENVVYGAAGNPNSVTLSYSNDPNGDSMGTTAPDTVKVFTYLLKADKTDGEQPLEGAGFTLYKKNSSGTYAAVGTEHKYLPGTPGDETATSFVWKGIDDGDYRLVETTTPAGYNTGEPLEFTVTAAHETESADPALTSLSGGDVVTGVARTGSLSVTVVNREGSTLPETGGMGTGLFYLLGGGLAAGALVLLVTKKRMDRTR